MPHVTSSNSSGTGILPPTSPLPKDEAEDAPAFNDMLMAGVITLQDKPFRVAIIGAGGINFGTPEGPWNHSIRLEHKLGPRLLVTALIDPNAKTRAAVLQAKRDSFVRSAYIDTKEYNTLEEYLDDLPNHIAPNAVLVGSPPAFHGSLKKNCNAEILCAERIPGVALFVEKPISASPVGDVMDILSLLDKKKIIVSVGYMMRSLKVVHKAKEILASQQLKVTATTARYFCTYPKIMKADWWNKQICCGPIVEQATHFCDLSRFLAGDIEMGSIQAHALEHWEEAGQLNSVPIDESKIPAEDRIPRMTSAIWKYKDGGVGSLTHGITLHGTAYSTNLEVFADGYQLRLVDLYNKPSLHVRSPETDGEQIFTFPEDDPYQTQLNAFIAAIEEAESNPGNEALQDKVDSQILSTYADAVKTYAFTWAIRLASENKNKKLSQVVDLVNAIAIEE